MGSNNITESGLYVNVEAGLQVDTEINAPVVVQALDANLFVEGYKFEVFCATGCLFSGASR